MKGVKGTCWHPYIQIQGWSVSRRERSHPRWHTSIISWQGKLRRWLSQNISTRMSTRTIAKRASLLLYIFHGPSEKPRREISGPHRAHMERPNRSWKKDDLHKRIKPKKCWIVHPKRSWKHAKNLCVIANMSPLL